MLPNKLWAKDADGNIVPFEVDGVEFIDGSILADLPFKRMSTLFNVSNFIVSQVRASNMLTLAPTKQQAAKYFEC